MTNWAKERGDEKTCIWKDGYVEATAMITAEHLTTKACLTVRKGYECTLSAPAKLYDLPEQPKLLHCPCDQNLLLCKFEYWQNKNMGQGSVVSLHNVAPLRSQ